jgi:uncharacterized protein (TIRG00374 family)
MNNLLKISWKRLIIITIIGIAIIACIPQIIGIKETLRLLAQINPIALYFALFSEAFFYIGSAIMTRTVLKMTGDNIKFEDMLKLAILDSMSVQIMPVGSLGEGAVDYYFLKLKKIKTHHIFLLFIIRTTITYFVFAFIYLVGVAFSPTNSSLSKQQMTIVWIAYLSAFVLFFYLISLYLRPRVFIARVKNLIKIYNPIARILRFPQSSNDKAHDITTKVYEGFSLLKKRLDLQISATGGALLFWFGDIFCLYFSILGFGYHPHLSIIIFAYAVSKILSLLSFIPGGLGVMEASLSLILIGFGVPASNALAGVLIFRLISFWLPVPIGISSFLSLNRKYNQATTSIKSS